MCIHHPALITYKSFWLLGKKLKGIFYKETNVHIKLECQYSEDKL